MGGKKCDIESFETTSINDELEQIRQIDENRYFEVVSFLNDYSNNEKERVNYGALKKFLFIEG